MRTLYLFAYDISCPKRQAKIRRLLQGYATGHQKSLYECWVTPEELSILKTTISQSLVENDTFHFFRRHQNLKTVDEQLIFGCAKPLRYDYFIVS